MKEEKERMSNGVDDGEGKEVRGERWKNFPISRLCF